MRIILIGLLLFGCLVTKGQDRYTVFPRTNYQFILPDSSFHLNYDSTAYFSEKYSGRIEFLNNIRDTALVDYTSILKALLLEFSTPGITILSDKEIPEKNIRLFKVKIDFDITDQKPKKSGASNIGWTLLFNDNGKAVVLMADYRSQYDEELSDIFSRSLSSFTKK